MPELDTHPRAGSRAGTCLHVLATALLLTLSAPALYAQPGFYETEPNDTPHDANRVSGAVSIYGTMVKGDQDGYLWTVSDEDARKRWTFELQGIPGKLTIAEIVRVDYADNGEDVTGVHRLMKMGTRDGLTPAVAPNMIFEPGEYLIGIAYAGGGSGGNSAPFRPPVGQLDFKVGDETPEPAAAGGSPPQEGAYRFLISQGDDLSVDKYPGERSSRKTAQDLRPNAEFATFETQPSAWYAIDFGKTDKAQLWDLAIQVPVGRQLDASLVGADGKVLATAKADRRGQLTFPDLAPQGETWYVDLEAKEPGFIHAVRTSAAGKRVSGQEAEPNDKWELANRVDLSQPVSGRFGEDRDTDQFRFIVDEAASDQLLDIKLEATAGEQKLRFCLLGADGRQVQCREDKPPIELSDLLLQPGDWGFALSRGKQGFEYRITAQAQGPVEADHEVEPNDDLDHASSVPANNRIKGRFTGDEDDVYRFLMAGAPQLWRFQAIGDSLTDLAYYDGSGKQIARTKPARGAKRARLENVFLLPGQHYIRVRGTSGGDYTLLARPLGPPDPNGEQEPNDDATRMQRLAVGQTRQGTLPDGEDVDYYRFFLANWDHVRLTVQPPPDGTIHPYLYWYDAPIGDGQPGGPGEPLTMEGLFPPGDYHVRLDARQASELEYQLSLERLPRFSCPADCEPNGMSEIPFAAPLPPDHVLTGVSGEWRDTDNYRMPTFDKPTSLLVRTREPVGNLWLGPDRYSAEQLKYDSELGGYPGTLPAGEAQLLLVDSRRKPYRLEVQIEGGKPALPSGTTLPAKLDLALDANRVAAFREHGQRVKGQLQIRNNGQAALAATLDWATSDYRWSVSSDRDSVELAPGAETSVPVTIQVPGDAWSDQPVRISVRARDAAGAQAETWGEITSDPDVEPVQPDWGWEIPDSLRGGFNAAWSAFGGTWSGDLPAGHKFEFLRDELVFQSSNMICCSDAKLWEGDQRPELTLQLPGKESVPVAGIAIDHFGSADPFRHLRKATLLLSEDGVNFTEAMHIETLPVETEQYFPLPKPQPARFARLRMDETFNSRLGAGGVLMGEWKVILQPGFDLSAGAGFDIANPDMGGHLVWDAPPQFYAPKRILTDGDPWQSVHLRGGDKAEFVIGFHHDRTAQINRIEWKFADDVDTDQTPERVLVAVSTDSPVGPWTGVGDLPVGEVEKLLTFDLKAPTWARFVKLTAVARPGQRSLAEPDLVRILERPTGSDYQSVLTEWGYASPRAWFEFQQGLQAEAALKASGNTSRDKAATLEPGQLAAGEVALSRQEHWYRLTVPADANTLTVTLSGEPTVRTMVELQDASGTRVPMRPLPKAGDAGHHVFEAQAEPGSQLFAHVWEPPRNVVFTWDTSASVNSYLPTIYNSLTAFTGQVVAGQEAVNLIPFGGHALLKQWLGEPYMLQTILNDYPRSSSSSSAEATIKEAADDLAPLAGTKAIVVITDGITVHDGSMWASMRTVRPRIFGVGVGGAKAWNQDVFEDWASVNGGHYRHIRYAGEMEVAMNRATALMHRPANYGLQVDASFREAPGPGHLSVVAGKDGLATGGSAVELILDASGSMLKRMEGKRRIVIAREVLTRAVRERIPAGTPVALRVFGAHDPDSCRTDLEIPLSPLDPDAAAKLLSGIQAKNLARTPIADSLAAVPSDLKGAKGRVAIVLVTDGEETCDGDPAAVIQSLQDQGLDMSLNIVGFAIDDPQLEAQFRDWAELGGGRFFGANNQAGLDTALQEALRVPFTVYDAAGEVAAEGSVGGDPVDLDQGTYQVVVATSPPQKFNDVEVLGEKSVTLTAE